MLITIKYICRNAQSCLDTSEEIITIRASVGANKWITQNLYYILHTSMGDINLNKQPSLLVGILDIPNKHGATSPPCLNKQTL